MFLTRPLLLCIDHVFVTEMTYGCPIDDFVTNSMIVHAVSETPTGTYSLAPIDSEDERNGKSTTFDPDGPAPNATVLVAPFATCAHTWRDPTSGALVVVYEGRQRVNESAQKRCRSK